MRTRCARADNASALRLDQATRMQRPQRSGSVGGFELMTVDSSGSTLIWVARSGAMEKTPPVSVSAVPVKTHQIPSTVPATADMAVSAEPSSAVCHHLHSVRFHAYCAPPIV